MEEALLNFLKSNKGEFDLTDIKNALNISKKDFIKLRNLLKKLELSSKIYRTENGNYIEFPKNCLTGNIYCIDNQYVFVDEKDNTKISINHEQIENISSLDLIVVEINSSNTITIKKKLKTLSLEATILRFLKLGYTNFSFEELKKILNFHDDIALSSVLKSLELKHILFNEENRFNIFPESYIIGNIYKSNNNYIFVESQTKKVLKIQNEDFGNSACEGDTVILDISQPSNPIVKKVLVRQNIKERLLVYLEANTLNSNLKEIISLLGANKNDGIELKNILDDLEKTGQIFCDDNGIYNSLQNNLHIGTIFFGKNDAFVEMNKSGKGRRASIKSENLNGALAGDKVLVELGSGKKAKAKVIKVLKRINDIVVCEVIEQDNVKHLIPFNIQGNLKLRIDHKTMKTLTPGQRIIVKVSEEKTNDDIYEAFFVNSIGYKNDPDIDLKSIAISCGFQLNFSEDSLNQANNLPIQVLKEDLSNRVDLRNEFIYTIDGKDAKDKDDAISIKKLSNGHYLLGVHISHVSHYVSSETPLFEEASERGTSLYMIDSVLPMLPQILSNGICSLNPNVDRLTRTTEMEIDEHGEVIDSHVYLSVINSKKAMTYEEVNTLYETGTPAKGYEDFEGNLLLARELNKKLNEAREKRGSVNFYSSELKFILDDGKIVDIEEKTRGEAENLIENCMLLANENIAKYSKWLKIPFVYRNHEMPDEKKILESIKFIKTLGFKVKCLGNTSSPKVLQSIIKTLSDKEEFPILSSILLSSMSRAKYSAYNSGHYALAVNEYTHFTSPIRRFPDLLAHTLLDYFENYTMTKDELKALEYKLQKLCDHSSLMERQADNAEIRAEKLKMIEYIEENMDVKFDATIISINPNFMKVKTSNGIVGIIYIDDMLGDKCIFDKTKNILKGKNTGIVYSLGLKIKIIPKSVSKPNLEIYFYTGTTKELKGIQKTYKQKES